MDKMDGMTMNIEQANVEKLKEVFPEVFADGKVDFDKLQGLLGHYIADDKEKYSFSWKGKTDSLRLAQKRSTGTLRPCKEESKNWDTTENLYIEGDNLEVLKLLQSSYLNSVKMIYIDPPYNTGNDFVYTDDFADGIARYKEVTGQATKSNPETAGRYHTNWLNMMYPRLKLARNLLTDDGVIFISIDDNEQANLKKLCDEVFGEDNFVAEFPRVTKKGGKSTATYAKNHDYIVVYLKNSYESSITGIQHLDEGFKYKDQYFEQRGAYKLNQTLDYNTLQYNKTMDYPLEINGETFVPGGSVEEQKKRHAGIHGKHDWVWRWSKSLFDFGYKNDWIVVSKTGRIYTKTYANASIEKNINGDYYVEYKNRTKPVSTLDFVENKYSNDNSNKEITALMGTALFDYVKPSILIKQIMSTCTKRDSIILDFFSGSATTAHAVMQLNAEDGGHRKFICVQLPEKTDEQSEAYKAGYKTICEIGKERIRRAGEKIKEEIEKYNNRKGTITRGDDGKVKHLSIWGEFSISGKDINIDEYIKDKPYVDIGFKVFKLDSSNLVKWENTPTTDEEEVKKRIQQSLFYLVEGREDLDLVYEIMLKYGLSLTLPVEERKFDGVTAYIINHPDYKVLICLQPNTTLSAVEEMDKETIGTYIFADRCFADANVLSNTEEILKKKDKEMRLF